MVDFVKGIVGVLGTILAVMVEFTLYPVALTFMTGMNSTGQCNATGGSCVNEFISVSDRAILANAPTLVVVIIIFTLMAGLILSALSAFKS